MLTLLINCNGNSNNNTFIYIAPLKKDITKCSDRQSKCRKTKQQNKLSTVMPNTRMPSLKFSFKALSDGSFDKNQVIFINCHCEVTTRVRRISNTTCWPRTQLMKGPRLPPLKASFATETPGQLSTTNNTNYELYRC